MQLQQLRYFVAVAEEGQFTRAAQRLGVAQPSVSAAIRDLERELGAPLLQRSRGAASLSGAGEQFLPWARQALADCEAGRAAVADAVGLQRGRLALGATPSLTTTALPAVLAEFHRRYPRIDLTVDEAGSPVLAGRLEQAELDLALVILPLGGAWVRATPLYEEELVLAVPPEHPLAGRGPIAVGELRDVPLVMFRSGYDLRTSTLAVCQRAGFAPVLAVDGGEMDGVLAMARAGLGAAVVPASVVPGEGGPLVAVRFAGGDLTRTVGLAARRDRVLPEPARALATMLETTLGGAHPGG